MRTSTAGVELSAVIDQAARDVAYESGLSAVTLRRVATRASLSPSVIAQQEPSMTALAARMFQRIATTELDDVTGAARAFTSPVEALWFVADEVTASNHGNEDWVWADAWSSGSKNPALAAVARDVTAAWTDFVAGLIRAAVEDGECEPVDAGFIAAVFVALVDGSSTHPFTNADAPVCRAVMLKAFLTVALHLPART